MARRPKIVLLGMLTKMPVGGVAWLVGQYAVGFERLGFEVYYVEAHALNPSMFMEREEDDATGKAARYIADVMRRFDVGDRWAFHALHDSGHVYGLGEAELRRLYRDAALIINMHGGTMPLPEHSETGRLVYLGTDPVRVELELHQGEQHAIDFLEPHAAFFTWGLNFGNPDCRLPWSERFPFVPSAPPVVVDFWDNDRPPERAPFTTIGQLRQQWHDLRYGGEVYRWSKHHELLKVLDLPSRTDQGFELALSSYTERDLHRLETHGWRVRSGLELSRDLDSYRDYIIGSRAEFTVAKDQNVRFRTGWFSERTATYLAAGRPVIMQDTGFGNALPSGEGLLAFADLEDAVEAVRSVNGDYERHRHAAREIARECLNYDVVLGSILDHLGLRAPNRTRRAAAGSSAVEISLPGWLDVQPASRRPLELPVATVDHVLARPIPSVQRASDRPEASVVVVTLDNLVLTRIALESVLANTRECSYEVVVVDNGSGDGTPTYLSVLAARNRHVRVLRNAENRGFAAAANQGLMVAQGDVLVLLNNDTIVTPGWLSGLTSHLSDGAVGLVGPVTNRCGNEAQVPTTYDTYGELLAFTEVQRAAEPGVFDIPVAEMFCVAMRSDALEAVGPLDERFEIGLFEDDDYARRTRDAGFRVICATDVFVHHFGEGSLGRLAASGRYAEIFAANRRRFEHKWGARWQPHSRRPDPKYHSLREGLREAVRRHVPTGSVVLVISKGDDELLDLPGLEGWHFPRMPDGAYAGHYPSDDRDAIAQLEQLRAGGARYLVVPAPALWWLEHYEGLRRHLDRRYRRAASSPQGAIYSLHDNTTQPSPVAVSEVVS